MFDDLENDLENLEKQIKMIKARVSANRSPKNYEALPLADGSHIIWFDQKINRYRRGDVILQKLAPIGRNLMRFFLENPWENHTKTTLIKVGWPDCVDPGHVSDESVFRVISDLRYRIEPNPKKPRYIITWRGRPEGGYRFNLQGGELPLETNGRSQSG